jgi:methyl-accepting chemotaxis protein
MMKVANEFDEKITKLESMVNELASNSLKLAETVIELTQHTAKIPIIDIDNLLKTLNEHSDEINENAASIKDIKNELRNFKYV